MKNQMKTSNFGTIEYKMASGVAQTLLRTRRDSEKKMDANEFLCAVVNASYGLKGHCTRVIWD